jgi:hypothetical protein
LKLNYLYFGHSPATNGSPTNLKRLFQVGGGDRMKAFFGLLGMVALIGIPRANATVEVRVINVGVADTGWIQCPDPSCSFLGPVGNYFLALDSGVRLDPSNPFLDMTYSANTTSGSPGDLIIETMADGYKNDSPSFEIRDDGNTTMTGTQTIAAYGGNNNNICLPVNNATCWNTGVNEAPAGTGSALIASGTFVAPPPSFHLDATGPGNSVNPYSLGIVFTFKNISGPGSVSGDVQLNAVPEPTAVLLLGGILLLTASALRRKVQRNNA